MNELEIRIYRVEQAAIRAAKSLSDPSDIIEAAGALLDEVRAIDGHEPRMDAPAWIAWLRAPAEDYRVMVHVGGQQFEVQDLVCVGCGRDLDSRAGWSVTTDGDDTMIVCPEHAANAAERQVA